MAVFKLKNEKGEIVEVRTFRGMDGRSAYEYAKLGGYTGTEKEFAASLAYDAKSEIDKLSKNSNIVYNAINYGISTESEDNTAALQALVDLVHNNGGGIIYFPVGTYLFKPCSTVGTDWNKTRYAILAKSYVSIVGENNRTTVLKQMGGIAFSMFYLKSNPDNPITGCRYENFTIGAYDTGNENKVYGKAFYYQYVRDCVFRDLILRGTVATALGIDYLDRVLIDNVNCIDCGRTFTGTQGGSSGIGIGTGGWENENFLIHNCTCKGSGQYGIFIENQYNLGWGGTTDFSKGCIISNCVVRNGLHKGIGVRGGQNVTVIGCEIYDNVAEGVFLDGKCKNVKILSCNVSNSGGNGIKIATTQASEKIIVQGNMCELSNLDGIQVYPTTSLANMIVRDNTTIGNRRSGISVMSDVDSLALIGNYSTDTTALSINERTLNNCIIKNNIFTGNITNNGNYTGNTNFNDLIE